MRFQTDLPAPPAALRHARGGPLRWLGKLYLAWGGWRVEGGFPEAPRAVIIVAPHTSNWDFTLGLAVVLALELRSSWLGKHTIFKPPFRGLLRWLGGIPVDRRAASGVVRACVAAFEAAPALYIALSPEGTRKQVGQWKSGFYVIAARAGVPILPVALDYPEHVVRFLPPFHPSGDLERDLPLLRAPFEDVRGHAAR